jgi:hypothetical protein
MLDPMSLAPMRITIDLGRLVPLREVEVPSVAGMWVRFFLRGLAMVAGDERDVVREELAWDVVGRSKVPAARHSLFSYR